MSNDNEEKKKVPTAEVRCLECGYHRLRKFKRGNFIEKVLDEKCPECDNYLVVTKIYDFEGEPERIPDTAKINKLKKIASEGFEVTDSDVREDTIIFTVKPKKDVEGAFLSFFKKARETGYLPVLRKSGEKIRLATMPKKELKKPIPSPVINITLLIATMITAAVAGYYFWFNSILGAFVFALSILSVVGIHELGHSYMARKHGVQATLPFFIPAPNLFGTFGAVINIKSPIPTKKDLFDLGVSGPLAGLAVAIPMAVIGLVTTKTVSVTAAAIKGQVFLQFPPLLSILTNLIRGPLPAGETLSWNPFLAAGWVGLLITMLNLVPVGMLDGGHIARAVLGEENHRLASTLTIFGFMLLGMFVWAPWLLWAIVMLIFTWIRHPGPLEDISELDIYRKILAFIIVVVFFLCLAPTPISPVGGAGA